jgi:SAM-dependent methyltransferase
VETRKARARRLREGFFEKYIQGKGIDIGCGNDPLTESCEKWDIGEGNATFMQGLPRNSYNWVYSSHCLEDLANYEEGLKNWWELVIPGGNLILFLPHRDLFERKRTLPSLGNSAHKWFFLIERDEPPSTIGLVPAITRLLTGYEIDYVKKCDEGYSFDFVPRGEGYQTYAHGEFSIEAVIKKLEKEATKKS